MTTPGQELLDPLDAESCRRLLRATDVGRLPLVADGRPRIVVLNHVHRTPTSRPGPGSGSTPGPAATETPSPPVGTRVAIAVRREKAAFGGIKFGAAFFGWLAATGMAVILTALLAGAGTALGVATNTDPEAAVDAATGNAETIGIGGAIAVAVILFAAYYRGGYVAGRMARFDGAKQGVAVWVWTIVIPLLVAGISAAVGSQYDVLDRLDAFPRIPLNGDVTAAGWLSLLLAAVVSLIAAVLGGLAGMRFHRRVDKAGLGH